MCATDLCTAKWIHYDDNVVCDRLTSIDYIGFNGGHQCRLWRGWHGTLRVCMDTVRIHFVSDTTKLHVNNCTIGCLHFICVPPRCAVRNKHTIHYRCMKWKIIETTFYMGQPEHIAHLMKHAIIHLEYSNGRCFIYLQFTLNGSYFIGFRKTDGPVGHISNLSNTEHLYGKRKPTNHSKSKWISSGLWLIRASINRSLRISRLEFYAREKKNE